ncbi:MAG: hypothetical protein LBH43_20265 [Treponema sp.]|nr:hypothetical protein [Treponema sp.]
MKRTMCFLAAVLSTGLLVFSCSKTGGSGSAVSPYKIPVDAEGVLQPDWVRGEEK